MPNNPRYVVDGLEFPNLDSNYMGDGAYPPFRVFDVEKQLYISGLYPTRQLAQAHTDELNKGVA